MRVKSANALDALQMKKGNSEWVREVRKEHPPFSMEEYLHDWELFFDQYAAEIDYWHDRNAGYHKAVTSLVGLLPTIQKLAAGSCSRIKGQTRCANQVTASTFAQ